MAEFFLELVSEEIPPAQQEPAAEALDQLIGAMFKAEGVDDAHLVEKFSTPLRFGVCFDGVPSTRQASLEERRGPPENAPAKALDGFKRSAAGAKFSVKNGYHFATFSKPEMEMKELLLELLPPLLRAFPWQKSMRWIEGNSFRWVRPLGEITCLLDGALVDFEVANLTAGNKKGVRTFADYKKYMEDKNILINPQERENKITKMVQNEISKTAIRNSETSFFTSLNDELKTTTEPLQINKSLIKKMAALSEAPIPFLYKNDELETRMIPESVLTSIYEKELFYQLHPQETNFIAVINNNNKRENIKSGLFAVLNARIKDAAFFIDEDNKLGLEKLREKLKDFPFYPKLLTMLDKVEYTETSCKKYNDPNIQTAAHYCKADIASQTGREFPESLGAISAKLYYNKFNPTTQAAKVVQDIRTGQRAIGAKDDPLPRQESDKVWRAILTHYKPIGAKDDLPSKEGQIISLEDRTGTLVWFFSIGEIPTGSRDPSALRREAIGMIRIILESTENDFTNLNLMDLFAEALALYGKDAAAADNNADATLDKLRHFITERLKYHLRADYPPDLVDAAIKDSELNLKRIVNRLRALQTFLKSADGKSLIAAWKRISGILKNTKTDAHFKPDRLVEEAEKNLARQLAQPEYEKALESHDFAQAFAQLAALGPCFDAFFDNVRVESDDKTLRQNRFALCAAAQAFMLQAADFSKIQS